MFVKQDLNTEERRAYRELFVNRDDAYLIQDKHGIPSRVNSPLTDDILFDPNENVGAYQLNANNQVKYAVLNIDLIKDVWDQSDFDLCDWIEKLQEQTIVAQNLLKSEGIQSLVEYSGFKGFHIWIFFGMLYASQVTLVLNHQTGFPERCIDTLIHSSGTNLTCLCKQHRSM